MRQAEERKALLAQGFTRDQIAEIQAGEKAGLPVEIYARKEFMAIQMHQIRLGLADGLAVESYASPEYDWFQMEEIRKGLKKGIDVSCYAQSNIPYEKMRQVRRGLLQGIDLSPYIKLDAGVLKELRRALLDRVNIIDYIKAGYDRGQLEQIRLALKDGIGIEPYLSTEFQGASIREMSRGIMEGLDISIYAKPEYGWLQMREIRLGMEDRVNVELYTNPLYSWDQMQEIRLGLEAGLDIGSYRSLMYTAREMKVRRELLEQGELLDALEKVIQVPEKKNPVSRNHSFIITVSEDEMEAYVESCLGNGEVSREEIEEVLAEKGIVRGILEKGMEDILSGDRNLWPVLIAKGRQAVQGRDGWYEYFFDTAKKPVPELLKDGSVDFRNMNWLKQVEQGQKIVYYHSAEIGIPGYTITGKLLSANRGKEKKILTGKGFELLEDKKTYIAAITGRIELLEDERIEISPLLILDELTVTMGNIDFKGDVHIQGNVGSGTVIKSAGDVIVDGFIESSVILCDGQVLLRQGMNAAGEGYIRAGKSVYGKFFEAVRIETEEDIHADYCLNCELYAEGSIQVSGNNGLICGGSTYAAGGIIAKQLGNRVGVRTNIMLGMNDKIRREQAENMDAIKETDRELRIFWNSYRDFQEKYPPEVRNSMELYLKIEDAIYIKKKQRDALHEVRREIEEKIEKMKDVKAVVQGFLYEGVRMEIDSCCWYAGEVRNVTIKRTGNRLAVYTN